MNDKQFGGNYDTSHTEINSLFKLKTLNSFTLKSGFNHKNKRKSSQIKNKI